MTQVLTRRVLRESGVTKHGWQYELPLGGTSRVCPNDIVCATDPVSGVPDLSIHFLVRTIDEDGQVVATRIYEEQPEEDCDGVGWVFSHENIVKIATAFKANL